MNILAIIPARGGSKRLPGKNVKSLLGKPLIKWTIESALSIPEVKCVLVSTDDHEIAEIAKNNGAHVPWLRPAELSTDHASSVDVCVHALNWYEDKHGEVDGVLLLQPTSPFRRKVSMELGIKLFIDSGFKAVVGVSPAQSHPYWCYQLNGNFMVPLIDTNESCRRSQDLPPSFAINGAFYLITPAELRLHRSFVTDETIPLVMNGLEESCDIDTSVDWMWAEFVGGILVDPGSCASLNMS